MDQRLAPLAEPGQTASRRRWLGLVVISLGVAMIIVDATLVNVAIPSFIDDLAITSTEAQWVQEVYTLVFAALLLVFGRLADRWGRRLLFGVGAVVFAAASVLAAQSGSGPTLIGARALQGLGGAVMLPTSLSLLNATFRGQERNIAFGVWGATIGGTAALGPLLGGWLTTSYSWRWAFGINIPLCLVVLVFLVSESREVTATQGGGLARRVPVRDRLRRARLRAHRRAHLRMDHCNHAIRRGQLDLAVDLLPRCGSLRRRSGRTRALRIRPGQPQPGRPGGHARSQPPGRPAAWSSSPAGRC